MILLKVVLMVMALAMAHVSAHLVLSKDQMLEYKHYVARGAEALGSCLESRELKDLHARMAADRVETVQRPRKARGIDVSVASKRDDQNKQVKQYASFNHQEDINNPAWSTKNDEYLFNVKDTDNPNSRQGICVLAPESIFGPFWHQGQPERQKIRGGQQGIYMRLALQVIDLSTCKPMEGARVDVWHANAADIHVAVRAKGDKKVIRQL